MATPLAQFLAGIGLGDRAPQMEAAGYDLDTLTVRAQPLPSPLHSPAIQRARPSQPLLYRRRVSRARRRLFLSGEMARSAARLPLGRLDRGGGEGGVAILREIMQFLAEMSKREKGFAEADLAPPGPGRSGTPPVPMGHPRGARTRDGVLWEPPWA